MKLLGVILITFFTSVLWAASDAHSRAKKHNPPSSLDYSVEVKSAVNEPEMVNEVKDDKAQDVEIEGNAIQAAAEILPTNESEAKPQTTSMVESASNNLSEDQIPVLSGREKPAEASSNGFYHKVVAAVAIVILMIAGLAFTTRKYFQKHGTPNKHTNIRVLTQHSLGPRKNLAIISVAGEHILLGITDQNINLIKSLSLMDDEIPEQTPAKFNAALKSAEARPDFVELTGMKSTNSEAEDGFSIRNLTEVVSVKLRGMKEFS